jgi:hypothetical protein
LISEQYDFRDNVSTESAIFKLTDSILKAWNNKEYVTGLFCDLTKAFDCVSHELLISKLKFCGINGSILKWLKSYLYNRQQRVLLQLDSSPNILSDWETAKHGVPQGFVLSPLLFRIQKRIIRIMSGLKPRDSCRDTFRVWRILPLQSQYIFSLLTFIVNNKCSYHTTSQIHGVNTRRNFDLYRPQSNLTTYQKGPYYFGIKLFNHLPLSIKELAHNIKQVLSYIPIPSTP